MEAGGSLDRSPSDCSSYDGIDHRTSLQDLRFWARITRATNTPDNLETPGKYKFNENPPPRCGLLFFLLCLPSSWLVFRLAFFFVLLLSISWTHHRTDRTTSKQQPCPLRPWPAPWARVCFCFIFHFFPFIFSISLYFFLLMVLLTYLVVARYLVFYCC